MSSSGNSSGDYVVSANVRKGEGPCTRPNGIAVSRPVAEKLGVRVGDHVLVSGLRSTVAVVESVEGIRDSAVYLGRITRINAKAHWNEPVKLRKITAEEVSEAERVVIGPSEAGLTLRADPESFKGLLIGSYVMKGDVLEVGTRSFKGPIIEQGGISSRFARVLIVDTRPEGVVKIVPKTEVVITERFREAETRSFVSYDDIGGLKEVIENLREMVEFPLRNPGVFRHLGVEPPKGVLLHGPPGTGKTMLAKAVAAESDAYFISIGASHLPPHEAERRLREVFSEAAQHAPAIIFIDEIDTIAPKREQAIDPSERRTVGALLELMDGIKDRGRVVVIAATNRVNALDPALRRPGRFDREIEVPLPNEDGRYEILQIHTRYMPLDADVDLRKIAESTHGYSGADLRLLCSEAAMSCIRRYRARFNPDGTVPEEVVSEMKVNMSDFIEGMKRITPSCGREFIVEIPKVKWSQVGGYKELKSKLEEIVLMPWKYRQEARKFGVVVPKGVLLYGPPGTGKTYIAKALANEAGVKVIEVSGASLKSKWFGEYEQNISKLFETARKAAPVVIIMDESESLVRRRGGEAGEAGKALDDGVNEFLRQLDGVRDTLDVFLVCTSNRPDLLDEAFLRSGRIEYHLEVPLPDLEARVEIFKVHLSNVKAPLGEDVDAEELARLTEGLTGADIKSIVESAVRKWFYAHVSGSGGVSGPSENSLKVGREYFIEAVEEVKRSILTKGGWRESAATQCYACPFGGYKNWVSGG